MTPQQIRETDAQWVLGTYARQPLFLERGEGAWVWDVEGRKYLDLTSGISVNALGHADPAVVAAVHEQISRMAHSSNLYFTPLQGRMARILCERGGFQKAFFCNSGTEANEAAIKFARKFWFANGSVWRHEIVSFSQSFHGRTYGALAATGQDKMQTGFGPMLPGFVRAELTVESLRECVGAHTAAVILEPILAEGGVVEPSAEFVAELSNLQKKHGFLLVCDEVQTGLGRTGEWFAFKASGLDPDLVTLAKPLGGGLPLGAVLLKGAVADAIQAGDHGTTFGGNPVAIAAGLAVLDRLEKPGFLENVRAVAAKLRAGLESLSGKGPFLDVRGRGMLLGIRVSIDPSKVIEVAREEGLIVYRAGADVVRFLPPLVLTAEQADHAIAALTKVAARL
ncbi:MAG: aspartate aminotransferase family protein [Fibrobacterota bacterium]|nr:aspartate aminotransferase family protein [Fibrobacterota bacterium]QQS07027.1 MAG: aspartate aminotransferase family protein [Fibrobacterota bacterium]